MVDRLHMVRCKRLPSLALSAEWSVGISGDHWCLMLVPPLGWFLGFYLLATSRGIWSIWVIMSFCGSTNPTYQVSNGEKGYLNDLKSAFARTMSLIGPNFDTQLFWFSQETCGKQNGQSATRELCLRKFHLTKDDNMCVAMFKLLFPYMI